MVWSWWWVAASSPLLMWTVLECSAESAGCSGLCRGCGRLEGPAGLLLAILEASQAPPRGPPKGLQGASQEASQGLSASHGLPSSLSPWLLWRDLECACRGWPPPRWLLWTALTVLVHLEAFFLHGTLVVQSAQARAGLELVVELSGGCAGVGGRGLPGFRKGFNIRRSIVICFGN